MENGNNDDEVEETPDSTLTIRETLETRRIELENSLKIVKHALNLMGGNSDAEEIYSAIYEAMNE